MNAFSDIESFSSDDDNYEDLRELIQLDKQ